MNKNICEDISGGTQTGGDKNRESGEHPSKAAEVRYNKLDPPQHDHPRSTLHP